MDLRSCSRMGINMILYNKFGAMQVLGINACDIGYLVREGFFEVHGSGKQPMLNLKDIYEFAKVIDLEGHRAGKYCSPGRAKNMLGKALYRKAVDNSKLEFVEFIWSPLNVDGRVYILESVKAYLEANRNAKP